jgi:two-component sensor histidine kinase
MDTYHPLETESPPVQGRATPDDVPPRALRARLVRLVAGTLLPLILVVILVVVGSYQRVKSVTETAVLQTAQGAMASVDNELRNEIAALEILALAPELHAGDFVGFADEARRFLSRFSDGPIVFVTDISSQIVFSSRVPVGQPLSKRSRQDSVEAVFKTGQPYVSDIFVGAVSQVPVFSLSVPVRRDGAVIYDLAFTPPRAAFAEILRDQNIPKGWVISIFDREGRHVARLPELSDTEITSASPSLLPQLPAPGDRIVDSISREGTPLLTAITHSTVSGWTVAIGIPHEDVNGPARRQLFAALGFSAVVLLMGVFFASRLATKLTRAELHRELLTNELNHRVKNTLSIVQGIVGRGLRDVPDSEKYRHAIEARLLALSSAHNVLSEQRWEKADLRAVAVSIAKPYVGAAQTFDISGPDVLLRPRVTIALALVLNELATNAVKYGALSSAQGRVVLAWEMTAPNRLRLTWTEAGGPPVTVPQRQGYGTKFIERAVTGELGGSYAATYAPPGFNCVIEIAL